MILNTDHWRVPISPLPKQASSTLSLQVII